MQGLGGAILFACSLALLADAFPDRNERVGALAAYGATIGGAFAVGPLVGGLLTSALDWRAIFLLNVPVGVVTMAVTLRFVRESRTAAPRRVDVPGQLLASLGLGALVYGLLRGAEAGWNESLPLASLAVAAVALVAFLAVERRQSEPMLPLGMFSNRAFTGAQLAAFAISSSLFAVFLYTTIYLQGVLHLSPVRAGLVYLPATAAMFVVAAATAQIGRRVPVAVTLSVSLVLVAAGLVLMTDAGTSSSSWVLLPGFTLSCSGAASSTPR